MTGWFLHFSVSSSLNEECTSEVPAGSRRHSRGSLRRVNGETIYKYVGMVKGSTREHEAPGPGVLPPRALPWPGEGEGMVGHHGWTLGGEPEEGPHHRSRDPVAPGHTTASPGLAVGWERGEPEE